MARRPPLETYNSALWDELARRGSYVRNREVIAFNAARRSRLKCANLRAVVAQLRLGVPLHPSLFNRALHSTNDVIAGIERYLTTRAAARRG